MSVKVHEAFSLDSARRRYLFFDHFLGDSLRDLWSEGGTGSAAVVDAQDGGIVRLTTGALDTNEYHIEWGENPNEIRSLLVSKKVTFEVRARINNIAQINCILGLYNAFNEQIAFVEQAGTWLVRTRDAGGNTQPDSGVALDTDYHIYRFECLPTGEVHFYIDDTETGNSPSTTNITALYLMPYLSIATTENVAKTLDIDYVVCRQER